MVLRCFLSSSMYLHFKVNLTLHLSIKYSALKMLISFFSPTFHWYTWWTPVASNGSQTVKIWSTPHLTAPTHLQKGQKHPTQILSATDRYYPFSVHRIQWRHKLPNFKAFRAAPDGIYGILVSKFSQTWHSGKDNEITSDGKVSEVCFYWVWDF